MSDKLIPKVKLFYDYKSMKLTMTHQYLTQHNEVFVT